MALKDWKRTRKKVSDYDLVWIHDNQVDGVFVVKRSLGYVWGLYGFTSGSEFVEGIEKTKNKAIKEAREYMKAH